MVATIVAEVPVKMRQVGGSSSIFESNPAGFALRPAIEITNGKVVTTSLGTDVCACVQRGTGMLMCVLMSERLRVTVTD